MKRVPKWLETEFSQHSAAVEADEPNIPVGVRPMGNAKEESSDDVAFDAKVPGRIESDETGKNVLIPNKYASDDTSALSILDESSPGDSESDESGESAGDDPYNSGSFDMSKSRSWKSRSRK